MNGKIVDFQAELVRISTLLLKNMDSSDFLGLLVDHSYDISFSDLACLYLPVQADEPNRGFFLEYKRGNHKAPKTLAKDDDFVMFLGESDEALILTEPGNGCLSALLLSPDMQSGIALPLGAEKKQHAVLILNSLSCGHYSKECFDFLYALSRLAGAMFSRRSAKVNRNGGLKTGDFSGALPAGAADKQSNKE